MGEMQANLERLLSCNGKVTHGTLSFPTVRDVQASNYENEIDRVYRALGGMKIWRDSCRSLSRQFQRLDMHSGTTASAISPGRKTRSPCCFTKPSRRLAASSITRKAAAGDISIEDEFVWSVSRS